MPPPASFNVQDELNFLRQRLKADRDRSAREQSELIHAMQMAMEAARAKQTAERDANRRQEAFLRKCRAEADAARKGFEADVRRTDAFVQSSEKHRARREAERRARLRGPRRAPRVRHAAGVAGRGPRQGCGRH